MTSIFPLKGWGFDGSRPSGITKSIADDIEGHLEPLGCAVILEAQHGCMRCRGVKKQNAVMTTSAMRGVFFDRPEARTELLQLIHSSPV